MIIIYSATLLCISRIRLVRMSSSSVNFVHKSCSYCTLWIRDLILRAVYIFMLQRTVQIGQGDNYFLLWNLVLQFVLFCFCFSYWTGIALLKIFNLIIYGSLNNLSFYFILLLIFPSISLSLSLVKHFLSSIRVQCLILLSEVNFMSSAYCSLIVSY